jgi:hypothetical protein
MYTLLASVDSAKPSQYADAGKERKEQEQTCRFPPDKTKYKHDVVYHDKPRSFNTSTPIST